MTAVYEKVNVNKRLFFYICLPIYGKFYTARKPNKRTSVVKRAEPATEPRTVTDDARESGLYRNERSATPGGQADK